MVERTCTDADIDEAVETPPQTTRARLRGEFIRRAKERKRDYTVDWVHLKLNDQAQRTVLCKDPFQVPRRAGREAHRLACSVPTVPHARRSRELLEERPGLQRVDTDLGPRLRAHRSSSGRSRSATGWCSTPPPSSSGSAPAAGTSSTGTWRATRGRRARARPHHEAALHEPPGRRRRGRGARARPAATDLGGMPVVVGSLHSQVPGVAAAIRTPRPERAARLRDDRRRRPAARALRPRRTPSRDAGLHRRHHHRRPRLRRRPRGGVGAVGAGPRPPRRRTPTSPSWRWARASSAPASPLGTTALEVAAILDAAAALGGTPSRCCACPTATRGRATRA